ncbi:MAG: thiolase family protein [Proteobacteria bacterium]|nr:thiolase family protein [Pseudomonadota bacterium]
MENKKDMVVVSAVRTPFSRFGGALRDVPSIILGAKVMAEVISRVQVKGDEVDEIYYGTCQPSETALENDVPDRQAVLEAGFPPTTLSMSIDRACTASLTAVRLAMWSMKLGNSHNICLAAGAENMSRIPFMLPGLRWQGQRIGNVEIYDNMYMLGYKGWNAISRKRAEIELDFKGWAPVALDAGEVAVEYGITREEQDEWAYLSQKRYAEAFKAGKFKVGEELMSLSFPKKKGPPIVFDKDEFPRPDTTLEKLAKLPTIYGSPTVTAGNAPGLDAGAAAVLLMTRKEAEKRGLKPLATVLSVEGVADEAGYLARVPAPALKSALDTAGMTIDQMDLIEINEAFAVMPLLASKILSDRDEKRLKAIREKLNINGGAIAIGHPVGASGARILMTLIYELKRRGGGYGACAICGGLAQGEAAVVKVD